MCVRVRGDGDGPAKLLLKNIAGLAVPGDMVALLGPSGESSCHPVFSHLAPGTAHKAVKAAALETAATACHSPINR